MHFDLITQTRAEAQATPALSCNAGSLIYQLCPATGHCVVTYERIPCP